MSAVLWLEYKWADRKEHLLEIMNCVRFGLMNPWQLIELKRNVVSPEIQKVVNNPEVQTMIEEAFS